MLLQDAVAVVGYPIGGDTISVTSGVVSRIEVTSYVHGSTELLGVQIDAAINSGNSGVRSSPPIVLASFCLSCFLVAVMQSLGLPSMCRASVHAVLSSFLAPASSKFFPVLCFVACACSCVQHLLSLLTAIAQS